MSVRAWCSGSLRGRGHDTHPPVCRACQDSCRAEIFGAHAIAAVSDGHGGNRYYRSSVGSRIAVDIAIDAIKEHLSNNSFLSELKKDPEKILVDTLADEIVSRWREAVDDYDANHPSTPQEIEHRKEYGIAEEHSRKTYGATLLICVLSESFSFGIQIGDGDVVAIHQDTSTDMPIPEDERCVDNKTTSLSDKEAEREFRYFCAFDDLPSAITVSSDGVSTCWETFDYPTNVLKFMEYARNASVYCVKGIENLLLDNLIYRTTIGHEDDVSMCVLYDPDRMTEPVELIDEEYKGYFENLRLQEMRAQRKKMKSIVCHRPRGQTSSFRRRR